MQGKATVILPALNELLAITEVVKQVQKAGCGVLVVDNASEDGTGMAAEWAGAKVIHEPRRGKGFATLAGIKVVETEYVIIGDADGTYPLVSSIPHILYLLGSGYDVVMCSRTCKMPGAMSRRNKVGNWVLTKTASILYGVPIQDLCTGLWGFKTEFLKSLNVKSVGFTFEAELLVSSVKAKGSIAQLPIVYYPREFGSNSKLKLKVGFEILWFLVKESIR